MERMSLALRELLESLDELLQPRRFKDYCPNGLQLEGRPGVKKLVTGVTACQELIDAAIELEADAVLVHHGLFWTGDSAVLTGMKKRRVAALLRHDISLLAYHLPLDAHPEFGNNASLARLLQIDVEGVLEPDNPESVGNIGRFERPLSIAEVMTRVSQVLEREALHIGGGPATVERVAWCTGAAQSYIEKAVRAGAELFISGEVSEPTVHVAREEGIHYIAAGHHATERYGVQALGQHLVEQFGLDHQFVDIDNPV
jgi:dinuclear metal center YbgI/SA1388 family protein